MLLAFTTDGDEALIAFLCNFSEAKQFWCFVHLKQNIAGKFQNTGMPPSEYHDFISDIFGVLWKRNGWFSSVTEFHSCLQSCKEIWLGCLCQTSPSFFDQFSLHYADIFRHTTLKCLRRDTGSGDPLEIFTTNVSESLNAVSKKNVSTKEIEWPQFNEAVKELISAQRVEVIWGINIWSRKIRII